MNNCPICKCLKEQTKDYKLGFFDMHQTPPKFLSLQESKEQEDFYNKIEEKVLSVEVLRKFFMKIFEEKQKNGFVGIESIGNGLYRFRSKNLNITFGEGGLEMILNEMKNI